MNFSALWSRRKESVHMTRNQMETCMALEAKGYKAVLVPFNADSPIPGLILFAKETQEELLMVNPDGSTTDLLKRELVQ